jgi:hypothetical protein
MGQNRKGITARVNYVPRLAPTHFALAAVAVGLVCLDAKPFQFSQSGPAQGVCCQRN